MKKIGSIFLILLITLCSSGFFIAWNLSLQSIRYSQKTHIANLSFAKEKYVAFVLSVNQIKNNKDFVFEDKDEFEYKGSMYDVVSEAQTGDSLYITCISDKDEDHLKNIVLHQILTSGKNNTGKDLPVLKFRLDNFTCHVHNNFIEHFLKNIANNYFAFNMAKPCAPYLNIASPPPWHIS